jgi:PIN domain nuclease of toxin-antitoxin system
VVVADIVLDASAVLALLQREAGADVVLQHLENAMISSVNLAELAARLADHGMPGTEIREIAEAIGVEVVSFDKNQAYTAASLRPITRAKGLSLGDRACLALAMERGAPALTADRAWTELDLGIDVRLIR